MRRNRINYEDSLDNSHMSMGTDTSMLDDRQLLRNGSKNRGLNHQTMSNRRREHHMSNGYPNHQGYQNQNGYPSMNGGYPQMNSDYPNPDLGYPSMEQSHKSGNPEYKPQRTRHPPVPQLKLGKSVPRTSSKKRKDPRDDPRLKEVENKLATGFCYYTYSLICQMLAGISSLIMSIASTSATPNKALAIVYLVNNLLKYFVYIYLLWIKGGKNAKKHKIGLIILLTTIVMTLGFLLGLYIYMRKAMPDCKLYDDYVKQVGKEKAEKTAPELYVSACNGLTAILIKVLTVFLLLWGAVDIISPLVILLYAKKYYDTIKYRDQILAGAV